MATSQANLMQTAVNVAATLTAAFVQGGLVSDIDEAKGIFASTRDDVFGTLKDQPNDAPAANRGSTGTGGGGTRGKGGGKQFTAEEARKIDLIFGAFKGVTLGELEGFDGEKCAEYGYGEGEKNGMKYIQYLANNDDPKAGFIKRAATAIVEDRRAAA